MRKTREDIRRRLLHGAWLLNALCYLTPAPAAPLVLPDAARPGAVRPQALEDATPPPTPAAEMLEVPAVIDRPFEIDEGPTVVVQSFRLLDAEDMPEFGISLAEIQARLAEEKRKHPQGFTIGQLQQAADVITEYYRENGLILAQAVVPVQTVQGGIVDFEIYTGKLGNVITESNRAYNENILKQPFKALIGQPVTKEGIESALLQLTDFPGLTVFGVFQPGKQVGAADIVLKVQEEDRLDVAFRADNHGLQQTGRMRWRTTIDWNNLTSGADKLSITTQQTYNPKNNIFLSLDYERYLGRGFKAGVFWNKNRFDVGGELAGQRISGKTKQVGFWFDKSIFRSRTFNLLARAGLTRKESDSFTRGRQANRDRLGVLSLEATMDYVDTRFRGINFATLEFSRGFNDLFGAMGSNAAAVNLPVGLRPSRSAGGADRRFAAGQFSKVLLTASRLQTIYSEAQLLLRAEYQWTDNFLVSTEQYSVGGPDHVRAYPQAQFLLDRAAFFSAELIHNMPLITDVQALDNRTWGELVQFSLFYDHANGRLEKPLSSDPQGYINFAGAGVQTRFTLPGKLEARLMLAWPVTDSKRFPPDNGRRPQFWSDLTYRF